MKVLHIINSLYIGGAEKLIVDALPIFKEKGIEISLLTIGSSRTFLDETVNRYGIPFHSLNSHNVYNPLNAIRLMRYLKDYDLIHVHLFPAQYWVAMASFLKQSSVPLVFTEHNTENRRWNNSVFKLPEKFVYNRYNTIVCITEQVKAALIKHLPQLKGKAITIENGIDISVYTNADTADRKLFPGIEQRDYLILMVAAFRAQKDHDTLIRAAKMLPNHVKILFVGTGERLSLCKDMVRAEGLENRILFLGNRSDVPSLLKMVDLSVLSSHWEGFGLFAAESMAAGVPVLASKVAGLAEVVEDDSLLFDPGNEEELSRKILQLITNKSFFEQVKNRAALRVKVYDISRMVDREIKLYEEILNRKKIGNA
ncbi:glycosyltransferase family 4 protein [Pedobacter sp. BG31]|uniref:glycosyltransferase family 4 protein n=1 Tax=Pedobacter sp. BG31 TaxID=3349697 RepID=UPI0035F4334E